LQQQVKPDVSNVITLTDLRRCGQAGTFLNAWWVLLLAHAACSVLLPFRCAVLYEFLSIVIGFQV